MPRPNRIFVEGGLYHVYNRLGRGERVFDQEMEGAAFVERLREVVERDGLLSRRRSEELVRARELLMILRVERYGLKVKDLARQMCKSPDGMSHTVARAARKRTKDKAFRRDLNRLDRALSGTEK